MKLQAETSQKLHENKLCILHTNCSAYLKVEVSKGTFWFFDFNWWQRCSERVLLEKCFKWWYYF